MSGIDKQVAFRSGEEHVRKILSEKFAEIWTKKRKSLASFH